MFLSFSSGCKRTTGISKIAAMIKQDEMYSCWQSEGSMPCFFPSAQAAKAFTQTEQRQPFKLELLGLNPMSIPLLDFCPMFLAATSQQAVSVGADMSAKACVLSSGCTYIINERRSHC